MKKKTAKPITPFHTSKTKVGSGDFQGTGYKNPMGTSKEIMGTKIPNKMSNQKKGKAPRSLA